MRINLMKVLADITIEAFDFEGHSSGVWSKSAHARLFYKNRRIASVPIGGFIDWGEENEDERAAELLIEKLAGLLQKAELND